MARAGRVELGGQAEVPGGNSGRRGSEFQGKAGRRGSLNEVEYLSPRPRNMGILGCVASTMNAVIGTGILALPVAFSRLGSGLGSVVIVTCALVCWVSLVAFGQVVIKVGGVSYGHTMDLAVGGWSGPLLSVVVGCFCFGVCVVYSVVISSNVRDLLFDTGLV